VRGRAGRGHHAVVRLDRARPCRDRRRLPVNVRHGWRGRQSTTRGRVGRRHRCANVPRSTRDSRTAGSPSCWRVRAAHRRSGRSYVRRPDARSR
jgi:hypothetical protein